jgi:hypothetical protein
MWMGFPTSHLPTLPQWVNFSFVGLPFYCIFILTPSKRWYFKVLQKVLQSTSKYFKKYFKVLHSYYFLVIFTTL